MLYYKTMDKWLMCVVALILGMLMFHMLKGVCGCNKVEGNIKDIKDLAVTVMEAGRRTSPLALIERDLPEGSFCDSYNWCRGKCYKNRCASEEDAPNYKHFDDNYGQCIWPTPDSLTSASNYVLPEIGKCECPDSEDWTKEGPPKYRSEYRKCSTVNDCKMRGSGCIWDNRSPHLYDDDCAGNYNLTGDKCKKLKVNHAGSNAINKMEKATAGSTGVIAWYDIMPEPLRVDEEVDWTSADPVKRTGKVLAESKHTGLSISKAWWAVYSEKLEEDLNGKDLSEEAKKTAEDRADEWLRTGYPLWEVVAGLTSYTENWISVRKTHNMKFGDGYDDGVEMVKARAEDENQTGVAADDACWARTGNENLCGDKNLYSKYVEKKPNKCMPHPKKTNSGTTNECKHAVSDILHFWRDGKAEENDIELQCNTLGLASGSPTGAVGKCHWG
jgi:hypothetical protein